MTVMVGRADYAGMGTRELSVTVGSDTYQVTFPEDSTKKIREGIEKVKRGGDIHELTKIGGTYVCPQA